VGVIHTQMGVIRPQVGFILSQAGFIRPLVGFIRPQMGFIHSLVGSICGRYHDVNRECRYRAPLLPPADRPLVARRSQKPASQHQPST
jgi:hypothetical protein